VNSFTLAGIIVGIAVYIPLCIQILSGKTKQNLATWGLWALLDSIAAASLFYQHGNFFLPALYALSSTVISLSILKSKNFSWTWFETMVAFMVVACIVIWAISGAYVATIASTTAVVIAGIPLTAECWKKPEESPFLTYLGFLVANALGVIGGKEWSVTERLYTAACTALCLVVVIFIARRFWRKPELQNEAA